MWKIYALIDFCNAFQVPGECVCGGRGDREKEGNRENVYGVK